MPFYTLHVVPVTVTTSKLGSHVHLTFEARHMSRSALDGTCQLNRNFVRLMKFLVRAISFVDVAETKEKEDDDYSMPVIHIA